MGLPQRCLVVAAVAVAIAVAPAHAGVFQGPPGRVLIFAAASLQTALDELAPAMKAAAGVDVVPVYAASSALARQIESGAPADIFISADLDWMDYVATRKLVRVETRIDLLGNQLVLVAPAGASTSITIAPGFALAAALGPNRIALADPDAVPAGKYAKASLTSLGVWDAVAPKVAAAENVRAALLLVSRGETPFGIVYRTDAMADRGVKVVGVFPGNTHPPIVYPAALTSTAGPRAADVLTYLRGAAAGMVFTRQGFEIGDRPRSAPFTP